MNVKQGIRRFRILSVITGLLYGLWYADRRSYEFGGPETLSEFAIVALFFPLLFYVASLLIGWVIVGFINPNKPRDG